MIGIGYFHRLAFGVLGMSFDTFMKVTPGELLQAAKGYYENSIGALALKGIGGNQKKFDPKEDKEEINLQIERIFGNTKK